MPAGPFPDCFSSLRPWCRDLLRPLGEQTWGTAGPSSSEGGLGALRRLTKAECWPFFPKGDPETPQSSHLSLLLPFSSSSSWSSLSDSLLDSPEPLSLLLLLSDSLSDSGSVEGQSQSSLFSEQASWGALGAQLQTLH